MNRSCLALLCSALLCGVPATPRAAAARDDAAQTATSGPAAPSPRGKKLVLKDGTFQIVRSYQRNGDRVRYYSLERSAWEELPADMVDWDATAKDEAEQARQADELAKKIHVEEESRTAQIAMDIDASLPVAPGVFLPSGEGFYAVEARTVTLLDQVEIQRKTDKKQILKQVIVPVPIVSGKQNLDIPGAQAKVRLPTGQPEFFLREAPPDPDRRSPIRKSSRPGEAAGPEVILIRAVVNGSKRHVASIHDRFGQETGVDTNIISLQRWDLAPNVFRFTLGQTLEPGEYVLAEQSDDGINMYVWDFGVDRSGAPAPNAKAQPAPH